MNNKKILLLALIFMTSFTQCTDTLNDFYSTSFLKNYSATRQKLMQEGFKKITFKTEDNLTLKGLFLSRPNAQYNVIACSGWRPGKKEGMATFYLSLPDNCNILLFDPRGRGESEGPILQGITCYGVNEFKDIIGSIAYINQQNSLPVFLIGLCSGAFNAAHALIHLEQHNKIANSNIKGFVFDSGWSSVTDTARTSNIANINKIITMFLSMMYTTKERAQKSYLYQILSSCNSCCTTLFHKVAVKPVLAQYEHTTNLADKIHLITSPIFFVHSYEDELTPIEPVINLSKRVLNKQCWWIEYSSHAVHHIKHKELYKEKLAAFIDKCLQ